MSLDVILGAGPVGLTLMRQLYERGGAVRVVTRSSRPALPAGVEHATAALDDPAEARRACRDAAVVYGCVGGNYVGWPERWPPLMAGMLAGAEAAGGTAHDVVSSCGAYRVRRIVHDWGEEPTWLPVAI